jgi:hypothetical protein
MTFGELGLQVLKIANKCKEMGMKPDQIQDLQILDSFNLNFLHKSKHAKDIVLELQDTNEGYVITESRK